MKSPQIQWNQNHRSTYSLGEINWNVHPNVIIAGSFNYLCKLMFLKGAMWNVRLFPAEKACFPTDYQTSKNRKRGVRKSSFAHTLFVYELCNYLHSFIYSCNRFFFCHRKEFESHKISHLVSVRCRDVCKEGFGLNQVADAGKFTQMDIIITINFLLFNNKDTGNFLLGCAHFAMLSVSVIVWSNMIYLLQCF